MEAKQPRFYPSDASPRALQSRVLAVLATQVTKLEAMASQAVPRDPEPDMGIIQPALDILKTLFALTALQEKEELADLRAAEKLSDAELDKQIAEKTANAEK